MEHIEKDLRIEMNTKISLIKSLFNNEILKLQDKLLSQDNYEQCKKIIIEKIKLDKDINFDKLIKLEINKYFKKIKIILDTDIQIKQNYIEQYKNFLEIELQNKLLEFNSCIYY